MIGIDIRELTSLKILQPICEYFIKNKVLYTLYHCDMPRGGKEYNRASLKNIKSSCDKIIKHAKLVRAYSNNKTLFKYLVRDKINKFVGVEMSLCYGAELINLESKGIKVHSILYLTDDMWKSNANTYKKIHRTYFGSEFLMNTVLKFSGAKYNKEKHKCMGTPLLDQLKNIKSGSNTLVLLPNIRPEHVGISFGSTTNFINIIKSLASKNTLIFKTRKKQWLPNEIKKYAKKIICDDYKMHPSAIVGAFNECNSVVMFYSSGIYESVVANKYTINITLPLNRWFWDKKKMKEYFSTSEGSLYQYTGIVESISRVDVDKISLQNNIDQSKREEWLNKFAGPINYNSAEDIAKDILES